MNPYHHVFSVEPKSGGEAVAVLDRKSWQEEDLFSWQPFTNATSYSSKDLDEEVVLIKGTMTVSF